MLQVKRKCRNSSTFEISYSLLDYPYFKEIQKVIVKDFSKQQAIDPDPKGIQKINFTGNFDRTGNATRFSNFKKGKNLIWIFH